MTFYANPRRDLPAPWKQKRAIFYAQGLKIYGQIPYILQRCLGAEFFSNSGTIFRSASLLTVSSMEDNYTVVPYRRTDGAFHSHEVLDTLYKWLLADKGFQWAVAVEFHADIKQWNAWNRPPETWIPGEPEQQEAFTQLFLGATDEGSDRS